MKEDRMYTKKNSSRTILNVFFLTVISFILLISSQAQTQSKNKNLLLSLDFNEQSASSFSGNQVIYGNGIEGKGLDMKKSTSIPGLKDSESVWFSNDRDFSISVWVKSNSKSPDTTIIISNSDFSKKAAGIYGSRRINKGFTLYCYNGAWGWNIGNGIQHYLYEPIAEDQPIVDNEWHQIVFTYSTSLKEVRLFYDGINKAVMHIGDLNERNFLSDLPLRIGGDVKVSPEYSTFRGFMDEFQVWGSVLSPEKVMKEFGKYSTVAKEPELMKDVLTIVNWNIWHGGTHFTKEANGFDGIERITELIKNTGADIVLMQETYGAGSRISSSLGYYYYEAGSTIGKVWGANLSVMSRFPIEDAYMVEERGSYGNNYAFNNGGIKIRLSEHQSVIAFSNWYNGGKPEDLDAVLKSWSVLIDKSDEVPIIFGGDFNSISHLDDGKGESGHSKLMTGAGFIDSYREIHPNVNKYPGYSNGSWTTRIDYVYYKGDKINAVNAGPIVSNFRGKEEKTPGYPSDHLGFVAEFRIK